MKISECVLDSGLVSVAQQKTHKTKIKTQI